MEENDSNEMEQVRQKHRKEKKDLQGKLQSLKKSASKGDKKKKKEVTEEMEKLEAELKEKQEKELEELLPKIQLNTVEEVPAFESVECEPLRVSKAQKRRSKKEKEKKERELRIQAQDTENLNGARHIETEKMKNILKKRNLMISDIPSDGDCLYNAIIKRIRELGGVCPSMKEMRLQTAEFLRKNPSEFLPYLCHPETGDLLNNIQFATYCNDVEEKAWGGQVELRALSHVLKRPVEVIQAESQPILFGQEYMKSESDKITVTYHRYMYSLGNHYNTVTEFREED